MYLNVKHVNLKNKFTFCRVCRKQHTSTGEILEGKATCKKTPDFKVTLYSVDSTGPKLIWSYTWL